MYLMLCHFLRYERSGATKVLSTGYLTPYVVGSSVVVMVAARLWDGALGRREDFIDQQ